MHVSIEKKITKYYLLQSLEFICIELCTWESISIDIGFGLLHILTLWPMYCFPLYVISLHTFHAVFRLIEMPLLSLN